MRIYFKTSRSIKTKNVPMQLKIILRDFKLVSKFYVPQHIRPINFLRAKGGNRV